MTREDKITAIFNQVRLQNQNKYFSNGEIQSMLSKVDFPYCTRVKTMASLGMLTRVAGRQYQFTKEPVYMGKVYSFIEDCVNYNKAKNEKYVAKTLVENVSIEKAIQVLKESGEYTIYKKVVQWEEVK